MTKPTLFLLHFAGGNCYSFQFLTPLLQDFDVISLELPGRGKRMTEPLLRNFDDAAHDMYQQILRRKPASKFLLYGHSMGAYLALRVAGMLEKNGHAPACLLVSGNPGPGIRDKKRRYLLPRDEFIAELKKLGGLPDELINNHELFDFFEPILRADFEVAENNELANEPAVSAPLFALMGNEEENVDDIANWGRFTRSEFNCEVMDGDHFFIHKHAQQIARIIQLSFDRSQSVRI